MHNSHRRRFLRHAMRGSAFASLLPAFAFSTATTTAPATAAGRERQRRYLAALNNQPWLLGYDTPPPRLEAGMRLEGRLPNGLRGTLFRNGPARHTLGEFRYRHWFDGDGMVQAFRFDGRDIRHRGRMVATDKYLAESAAERPLFPGFDTPVSNPEPMSGPDSLNPANISVLPLADRLLALWEAGSAWEMDPDTLETRKRLVFNSETDGLPFSAHPRIEPDGTLWNFGYASGADRLLFWRLGSGGRLVKFGMLPAKPVGMPHDFLVTEHFLIVLIPPLHFQAGGGQTFLESHRWEPDRPTRVLVVDKNDFDRHFWLELPAQWIFHYGNAYEDSAGLIHFDGASSATPDAMYTTFRQVMVGAPADEVPTRHFRFVLDPKQRRIRAELLLGEHHDSEFPVVDPRVSCRRNNRLYLLTQDRRETKPHHGGLTSISAFDYRHDRLDSYRYPDQQIPEEHLYVPEPGQPPETRGWVVGTALDYAAGHTLLNVFRADALADGPLATARLPYALPLGLHGKFQSDRG